MCRDANTKSASAMVSEMLSSYGDDKGPSTRISRLQAYGHESDSAQAQVRTVQCVILGQRLDDVLTR